MRIRQADFRTVEIEKLSISYRLRYSLYQDGETRFPESISCRGDTVVAYFLTSTIRDFIAETPHGYCIERHWNIVPEGSFGLSFCLELPADSEMTYSFPGVGTGRPVPESGELCLGDRTFYTNGLFLFGKPESVFVFSDPAASTGETGSIEVQRLHHDEENEFARVEIRIPAAVQPSKRETKRGRNETQFFQSNGHLEYNLRLNVVTAAPDQIHRQGISAVLERNKTRLHIPPRLSPAGMRETLNNEIEAGLKKFLLERGPLCGLLEAQGGERLSSLAGCTLALLQLQHIPEDRDAVELALRLVDFCLKGQHPRGQFYPYYWKDRQSWLPPDSITAVALHQSASIALMIVRIAAVLKSKGLPASSYLHAASHMADSLLQANRDLEDRTDLLYPDSLLPAGSTAAGTAAGSGSLVELFLELHGITGKDRYRKAVRTLKSGYFSRKPETLLLPGSEYATPDLDTALAEARAAVSLDGSGYPVKGLRQHFDALISRICLNRPDPGSESNPMGGINDVLGNPALLFRGFELAHTLLSIDARMTRPSRFKELNLLIAQLLGFNLQRPLGTSFFHPYRKPKERFGAVSSTIWTRELYYMRRLVEEFPKAISGKGDPLT